MFDRRAIIMLTRRTTPLIRKAAYSNWASVTEALSPESRGSNSGMPSRDQQRCLNNAHQLKERNWRFENIRIIRFNRQFQKAGRRAGRKLCISYRLFTVPYFSVGSSMLIDRCFRRAAILVSWCERNWGEYKVPVGRGGGGHGERKKIGRL